MTSHEQRRYWLMHESDGSGATFTTALYFRLRGLLDRAAMQAAFDDVVALHAVLRTRYEMSDELVAVVEASACCPLEYCDIGPVAEPMREIAFSAWLLDRASYRFDLRQAPLIRASLARAAPDDHGLVVCVHHIASDGWSSGRLVHDVLACYDARVAGRPPSLVPPAATYVDYAAHQARAASGRRHARALQFWCNRLAGAPSAIPLPSDRSPDRPVGFAGTQLLAIIGPEQSAALHQLARDHGATPYMVLLAALHVTMWLWTGARDQVIGSVMANRADPAFHDVAGCCLDFLPIRVELAGNDTGATIVERVRLCVIDALRNRECSINEMAAVLAPRTGRAKSPFYNVALIVETPRTGADSHALEVSDLPMEERFAELDLRVISRVADDELRVVWEYSTELFTEPTIRALASAYAEIIDQLAAAPDQRIDQLSLPAALAARVDETRRRADADADVVVASTFPVELAADALDGWLGALGVDAHVRVAPPDRIFDELAGSAKPRWRIICVRTADELGERSVTELAAAIRESAARTGVRHLVCLCAASGVTGAASMECELFHALGGAPNVRTLRTGEPAALGAEIARQISLETRPVTKVIVVDGDDTLWTGVCAEIGPSAVVVDAGRLARQHPRLAPRAAGVLLCLVSNNDPADITRVLTENSEMVLRREHFAQIVASWDPKPARLYALSAALGVDLESFVVLDDDPLACAAIHAAAPEIVTYEVPRSEDIPAWLARLWALDHMPVTADGRARADRQIDDVRRSALRVEHARYADFLADLALEVTIAPIEPGDLPRVLELVRRTTQLTNGLPGAPFRLGESLPAGVVARVRDRFGDYGLVGATLWSLDDGVARVSALAVSCRALGRGVEHALIAALGRCVARTAVPRIVFPFVATARNVPAQRFLDEVCGSIRGEAYELATKTAVALRFVPSEPPSEPERPDRPVGARAVTARALERAARGLAPAQRAAVNGSPGPRRLPTTEVERELFAMWRRLLRLDGMSIDDDFFDLGGTSLLATRMLVEIADRYGRRRPLGALFSQTTIATLADEIERGGEPIPEAAPATPSAERLSELIAALRVRPTLHIPAPARSARAALGGANARSTIDYVAPRTPTEERLAAIWAQVLGVDRVGVDDNFFRLGGDSFLVMRLVEGITRELGIELAPGMVFEYPTIAAQAEHTEQREVLVPPNAIRPDTTTITPDLLPLISLEQADIDRIVANVPGGVANIQDIYALSPLQEGMLFHHRLASGRDPYVTVRRMVFPGRALLDRYLGAVQQLVDRHDVFRTAFAWDGLSTPAQIVLRKARQH